jgi:hypothetical protein
MPVETDRSDWFVTWWTSAALKGLHCQGCVDTDRRAYAYRATFELALAATHLEKVEFLGVIYDYVARESAELRAARATHAKLRDTPLLASCPIAQLEHDRTMRRRDAATRILSQLQRLFEVVAPRPSSGSFLERIYAVASSIPHCDSAAAAHAFEQIDVAYRAAPIDETVVSPLLSEVELLAYVNRAWQHDRLSFPWAKVFQAWIIPPAAPTARIPPVVEEDHYA